MKLSFRNQVVIADTMAFESLYEPGLAMNQEEKEDLLGRPGILAVWMYIDGQMAGEAYGLPVGHLEEEIEDCSSEPPGSIYCYSVTVLPDHQRKGLGRVLFAFFLGMCFPRTVIGHATSEAAVRLNESFGAIHTTEHKDWCGTPRTAKFFRIEFPAQ